MARRRSMKSFQAMSRSGKAGRDGAKRLNRGQTAREAKRGFVLVCEGRITEPRYFRAIRRARAGGGVAVQILEGVGVPMAVAKRAVATAGNGQNRGKKPAGSGDRIWAVFDRDSHPEYEEAVALCERHGVEVARSDPCFELWLILHIEQYDKACSNDDVQRRLEALRPEYGRRGAKTLDFTALMDRVEKAEEHAAAQLQSRRQEGNPFGNPSTTVGRLTRAIREASGSSPPQ